MQIYEVDKRSAAQIQTDETNGTEKGCRNDPGASKATTAGAASAVPRFEHLL